MADRALALAAAVRVVAGVHDGAADGRADAHVALAAGLAKVDVLMVDVADLADDCGAVHADSNGRLSDGGWVYPVDAETLETLLERYRDVYPMESYAPDGAAKTAAIVLYEQ